MKQWQNIYSHLHYFYGLLEAMYCGNCSRPLRLNLQTYFATWICLHYIHSIPFSKHHLSCSLLISPVARRGRTQRKFPRSPEQPCPDTSRTLQSVQPENTRAPQSPGRIASSPVSIISNQQQGGIVLDGRGRDREERKVWSGHHLALWRLPNELMERTAHWAISVVYCRSALLIGRLTASFRAP